MTDFELEQLKYPIGTFTKPTNIDQMVIQKAIAEIAAFPERLKSEVENLSEQQLERRIVRAAGRFGKWSTIVPTAI